MADDKPTRAPELQGRPAVAAVALVVVALLAGSWWGWSYAGPLGGMLGVLLGAAVGTVGFTIMRARASTGRFADRPAPDVRELPPDQAMQVLTAMLGASADGVLGEIGKAKAWAEAGDLDGALAKLRGLSEEHPLTPAVPAAIARLLVNVEGQETERLAAARSAVRLALRGGMNRLAAQVFEELDADERASFELELSEGDRSRLGKALAIQARDSKVKAP